MSGLNALQPNEVGGALWLRLEWTRPSDVSQTTVVTAALAALTIDETLRAAAPERFLAFWLECVRIKYSSASNRAAVRPCACNGRAVALNESLVNRLSGGNADNGGLANVNWNDAKNQWNNRSFRAQGVSRGRPDYTGLSPNVILSGDCRLRLQTFSRFAAYRT